METRQLITEVLGVEQINYLRGYFCEYWQSPRMRRDTPDARYIPAWAILELGHFLTAREIYNLLWKEVGEHRITVLENVPIWDVKRQCFVSNPQIKLEIALSVDAYRAVKAHRYETPNTFSGPDSKVFPDQHAFEKSFVLFKELLDRWTKEQDIANAQVNQHFIEQYWRNGYTVGEIAKVLALDIKAIQRVLDKILAGVPCGIAIRELWDKGFTQVDIEQKLGLTHDHVHRCLTKYQDEKNRFQEGIKNDILDLFSRGFTLDYIVDRLRVDRDRVSRIIHDFRRSTDAEEVRKAKEAANLAAKFDRMFYGGRSGGGKTQEARGYVAGVDPGIGDDTRIVRITKDGKVYSTGRIDVSGRVIWIDESTTLDPEALAKLHKDRPWHEVKFYHEGGVPPPVGNWKTEEGDT